MNAVRSHQPTCGGFRRNPIAVDSKMSAAYIPLPAGHTREKHEKNNHHGRPPGRQAVRDPRSATFIVDGWGLTFYFKRLTG